MDRFEWTELSEADQAVVRPFQQLATQLGNVLPAGAALEQVLKSLADVKDYALRVPRSAVAPTKCCERDYDGDGNCDKHPAVL